MESVLSTPQKSNESLLVANRMHRSNQKYNTATMNAAYIHAKVHFLFISEMYSVGKNSRQNSFYCLFLVAIEFSGVGLPTQRQRGQQH